MGILKDLIIKLGLDSSGVDKGVNKAGDSLNKLSSSVKSIGVAFAAAFSLGAIKNFAKESLDAYKTQEIAAKKLESVINATGGAIGYTTKELIKYAGQLQKVTTFDDDATVSAMAVAASFKSIRGENFKQMISLAQDLSTILGQDLQSSVLQLGKALEQPEVGLTMLRRSGISFSTQQIESIKELTKQGKLYEAQVLILAEVNSQFGGAAKNAAESSMGPLEQLSNAWGDIKEGIGKAIIESGNFIKTVKQLAGVLPLFKYTGDLLNDIKLAGMKKGFEENFLDKINDSSKSAEDRIKSLKMAINSTKSTLDTYSENIFGRSKITVGGTEFSGKEALVQFKLQTYEKQRLEEELADVQKKIRQQSSIDNLQLTKKTIKELESLNESYKGKVDDDSLAIRSAISGEIKSRERVIELTDEQKKKIEELEKARKAAENLKAGKASIADYETLIKLNDDLLKIAKSDDERLKISRENSALKTKLELINKIVERQTSGVGSTALQTPKAKGITTLEREKVDISDLDTSDLKGIVDEYEAQANRVGEISNEMAATMQGSVVSAFQALGTAIGTMGEMNAGQAIASLLNPIADMAISAGTMIMMTGTAIEALKASLVSFFGGSAIVAGAALVAVGVAAKAGLAALASGGGSGGQKSASVSGGSFLGAKDYESRSEMVTVQVEGKLKGSDIYISNQKEATRRRNGF